MGTEKPHPTGVPQASASDLVYMCQSWRPKPQVLQSARVRMVQNLRLRPGVCPNSQDASSDVCVHFGHASVWYSTLTRNSNFLLMQTLRSNGDGQVVGTRPLMGETWRKFQLPRFGPDELWLWGSLGEWASNWKISLSPSLSLLSKLINKCLKS